MHIAMERSLGQNWKKEWHAGLFSGLPICLGYLTVSFGVGILAVRAGLTPLQAVLLSVTNLTSAGQAAGIGIIAAGGSYLELAISQFVINLRYSLMGLSLSQRTDEAFTTPRRLLISHGITDEIFGVAFSRKQKLTPWYMYGMTAISVIGWTLGTLLGAVAGELLPARLVAALGILLYAMFLAIIIPPARKSRRVLFAVALAAGLHLLFYYAIPAVSDGFAVILSGLIAAVLAALFFPVEEEAFADDSIDEVRAKEKEGCPQ